MKIKKILLILVVLTFSSCVQSELKIKSYQKNDKEFILEAFKKDRYWLVENPYFSEEYLLEHLSPKKDPAYWGKEIVKVLYKKDKPVGFIAYYKPKFYEGYIHLLWIVPEYRSKGYAAKLAKHAIDDLLSQNVSIIKLVTRTSNHSAIKLYKNLGFKETDRDEGFVDFEYRK